MRLLPIVLFVLALSGPAPLGASAEEESSVPSKPYAVGDVVAEFSGPGLDEAKVSLGDMAITPEKARAVVLEHARAYAEDEDVPEATALDALAGLQDEDGELDEDLKAELVGKVGRRFGLVATDERLEEMTTLADLVAWVVAAKDEPIAIVIWASACDTCVRVYNDKVNELVGEEGFRLLVVASHASDTPDLMRDRLEFSGFYWRVMLDQDQRVNSLFGGRRTPHVFLLDQKRTLRYRGSVDSDSDLPLGDEDLKEHLRDAVRAVRKGREVEVTETEPIGCPLRVKKT